VGTTSGLEDEAADHSATLRLRIAECSSYAAIDGPGRKSLAVAEYRPVVPQR